MIDKSSKGLDALLSQSESYLWEKLRPLNPEGVIGNPLNDTHAVFTASCWLDGLIRGISNTGIAIMICYEDQRQGYEFFDRVAEYAITHVPVLTEQDMDAAANDASKSQVSDCIRGIVEDRFALRIIKDKKIVEALKPVYTTLSILGDFSQSRDYTTKERFEMAWRAQISISQNLHKPMYQFELENLGSSYQEAIRLLQGIEPTKIREISIKHQI